MTVRRARKGWMILTPWLMTCALAITNALLLGQNLRLRSALGAGRALEALKPGDKVQPFSAQGLQGEGINIRYAPREPERIFFYFTPTCQFCRAQFAYWRGLLERADRERFEIVGLVSEAEDKSKLGEYLRGVGCSPDSPTPLRVALVPDNVLSSYKLSATPITLVVAGDGTVERVWRGQWSATDASIAEVFGLSPTQLGSF